MSRWSKLFWCLSALGGLWAIFVSLLLDHTLQRHLLYLHKVHTAWYHDIDRAESFGFGEGQVTPFRIATDDNESLYAWHVLPMGLYAQQHPSVTSGPRGKPEGVDFQSSRAFEMLKDPQSRLIINFHGNAGHVAQGWRTAAYKSLSTADNSRIHILTFDYRGFGLSTGNPTEQGLINDGVAVVNWALNIAQVPPHRIVLIGHSLGTAVATAVAEHFATPPYAQDTKSSVEFGGLVLASGFSDLPNLLKTYLIGGVIPVLSPLSPYPRVQRFFANRIVDTWNTTSRLQRLASSASRLRLHVLHARNDFDVGWKHSDLLFDAAAAGLKANPRCGGDPEFTDIMVDSSEVWTQRTAACSSKRPGESGCERLSRTILRFGGHNRVLTHHYLALAVRDLFNDAEKAK